MTPRALHIQNEASGPARLFVEELEGRGFEVVTIDARLDRLPQSPEGFAAVLSGGQHVVDIASVVGCRDRRGGGQEEDREEEDQ